MIYSLRRKFITITAISVGIVFAIIFAIVCIVSTVQLNRNLDELTDVIAANDGKFPETGESKETPPASGDTVPDPEEGGLAEKPEQDDGFTPDTKFSTRFFTVWIDESGNISRSDINRIASVTESEAEEYALQALEIGRTRGWISAYRYKLIDTETGNSVVFVNGEVTKGTTLRLLYALFFIMAGSFAVIIVIIILLSKRAVKPAAESYEKQRQFVTDANHELKTPLTLILSNVDIVESELGRNEWLDDIRSEGDRMGLLINQLVTLSRMDEDTSNLTISEFDLSAVLTDAASEFEGLAASKDKAFSCAIEGGMRYNGDEDLIRKLISILLDNAIKYCDPSGTISFAAAAKGRGFVITVENSYRDVNNVQLGRLFDRFYRADKTRTPSNSFGVGLSIAKAIAKKHRGDITAYKKDSSHIGFKVTLR